MPSRRRSPVPACALLALLCAGLLAPAPASAQSSTVPLIAAAGDIACGPNNRDYNFGQGVPTACRQVATSNLLLQRPYSAVLPLGDIVYDNRGSYDSYLASYAPSWGRVLGITRPVIGNHEYDDGFGGQGYWDYFNGVGAPVGRAGTRGRGWYAFSLGSWRLIALNSNCDEVSCYNGSAQLRFLERQLKRHPSRCVLAYFHHPRYSSGIHGNKQNLRGIWRLLYRYRADVVLNGHDHVYERFARQSWNGAPDPRLGVTQFTIGTGGYFMFPFAYAHPNSLYRQSSSFGVLSLGLGPKRFYWNFITEEGNSVDVGSQPCTRAPEPHKLRRRGR